MTEPTSIERVAALQFMNDEVTREIEWMWKSFDTLDTKALALIGLAGVATSFLILNHRDGWYWVVPAAAWLGAILAGGGVVRTRRIRSAPEPDGLLGVYDRSLKAQVPNTKETLLAAVVATKAAAYRKNFEAATEKLRWYRWFEYLLVVAFVLSMFAIEGGRGDDERRSVKPSTTATTGNSGPSSTTGTSGGSPGPGITSSVTADTGGPPTSSPSR